MFNMDKELKEKMVDTALRHATEKAYAEILEEAPEVEFSQRHTEEMEKLFENYKKPKMVPLKWIAVVAAVLICGAIGVVASKPKILGRKVDVTETNTRIEYTENGTNTNTYSTDEVTLNYIPEGMELVENKKDEKYISLKFQKGQQEFRLRLTERNSVANLDTEHTGMLEFDIYNMKAYIMEKDGICCIKWSTEEYVYTIYGNLSKEEILNIIKNIE